jgi:hypothetical protein
MYYKSNYLYNSNNKLLFFKLATMNSMQIDILNPKAAKLLKDLADLKLIAIRKLPKNNFAAVLKKLRENESSPPSLEEIAKEVEFVRAKRYAK